jgi:hypothetical protein
MQEMFFLEEKNASNTHYVRNVFFSEEKNASNTHYVEILAYV